MKNLFLLAVVFGLNISNSEAANTLISNNLACRGALTNRINYYENTPKVLRFIDLYFTKNTNELTFTNAQRDKKKTLKLTERTYFVAGDNTNFTDTSRDYREVGWGMALPIAIQRLEQNSINELRGRLYVSGKVFELPDHIAFAEYEVFCTGKFEAVK